MLWILHKNQCKSLHEGHYQLLHWIHLYNVIWMDRKTATIHHIRYIRVTELRRHLIVLIWNSGKHIDANKPRCALTKVIKIGHYNSSVVRHCFLYLGRRLIESHVLFQKLNLSKYCCKLSFCGSYMELSGALKRHKKRHYTLYGIMYSQPVIIAKYHSFMSLWWVYFTIMTTWLYIIWLIMLAHTK